MIITGWFAFNDFVLVVMNSLTTMNDFQVKQLMKGFKAVLQTRALIGEIGYGIDSELIEWVSIKSNRKVSISL